MVKASGYILSVLPERAQTLLDHAEPGRAVGEPVPAFVRSNRAPLLVLISFTPGAITHIALGRKGVASGTALVRLNLLNLEELVAQVPMRRLVEEVPPRFRAPISRRLREGGLLSPKAFEHVVTALRKLAPDVAPSLTRFSGDRDRAVARLSGPVRRALAEQKESVALALRLTGLPAGEITEWEPPLDGNPISFLDGLPGARVREDAMVVHDLGHLPGFAVVKDYPFAAKVFEGESSRLTVILANKLPLEEQFGTDLIYYNETFRAFVMVQYKAMERGGSGKAEFRLPNDQLNLELARMDSALEALAAIPDDLSREGFRFASNPFFLKLCARLIFNPEDSGLFPGMYLPLGYWKRLVDHPATLGSRGGRLITFENVGRRLAEADFIALVAGGWIGTESAQSGLLAAVVREVLESGKAVALAVRTDAAS